MAPIVRVCMWSVLGDSLFFFKIINVWFILSSNNVFALIVCRYLMETVIKTLLFVITWQKLLLPVIFAFNRRIGTYTYQWELSSMDVMLVMYSFSLCCVCANHQSQCFRHEWWQDKKSPWTLNILTFCLTLESILLRKYHNVIKLGKSSIHDQPIYPRRPPPLFLSLSSLPQSPTLHQLNIFNKSRIKRNRFNLLNSNYVEIDFRELEEDKYWPSLLWSKRWLIRDI